VGLSTGSMGAREQSRREGGHVFSSNQALD